MPDTFAVFLPTKPKRPFKMAAIAYADDPATMTELADRVGKLKAAKAEIEAQIERMRDLFAASGQADTEGALFRVALGAESQVATIDRAAIERDMGESWLRKYLKWSRRAGSFTCIAKTGKPRRAAA
jgi:hypothetical protein